MCRVTAFIALVSLSLSVNAQSTPDPSQPNPNEAAPRVEEKPLSILYARDASGNYIPILKGVEYEEINRYLVTRIARSDRARPRQHSISKLDVDGVLEPSFANLTATIVFETHSDNDDQESKTNWIRLPLAFHNASLKSPPKFEGEGECVFQHDEADGFVAWYRGNSSKPSTIVLDLLAPAPQVADSSELRLRLPEATQSTLVAVIPGESSSADVVGGQVSEERTDEGSLFVKCVGLQSEFRISWRQGAAAKPQVPARLDVVGEIDVTVERIGLITSNVKLQLKSNQDVASFDLRIPANAQLVSLDRSNYEARLRNASSEADYSQYEIKLTDRADEQTVEFRIETTGSSKIDAPANVAAVQVVDTQGQMTVRQFGRVRIYKRPDLRVTWDVGAQVNRINDPQLAVADDLIAAFEYTRQPCVVNVTASPRVTRTTVTPLHILKVEANRIYLRSIFRCKVQGGGVSEFTVQMNDWSFEYAISTEGAQVIDQYSIDDSRVRIVLETPISDEFEFTMRAHKTVQPPDIRLKFPVPVVNSLAPAVVLVAAADNVTLDFPNGNSSGFLQDAVPVDLRDELTSINTAQPIRCFRMQSEEQSDDFAIQSTVRPQRVHLDVASLVLLSENGAKVRQRFSFDIQYERMQTLRFQLPREVYEFLHLGLPDGRFATTINGDVFDASEWLRSIVNVDNVSGKATAHIQLPESTIGSLVVDVDFTLFGPDYIAGPSETVDVPLITYEQGPNGIVTNQVVVSPLGVRVNGIEPNSPWQRNDQVKVGFPLAVDDGVTVQEVGLNAIGAVSQSQPDTVQILATTDEDSLTGTTTQPTRLDRAWVHTTISSGRRQDQAAFLLQTGKPQVELSIPNQPAAAAIRVWVNSQEVTPAISSDSDSLTIPLESSDDRAETTGDFLIEAQLEYSERPRIGKIKTMVPELAIDTADCSNWVWQLTLPPSEHLISSSDDLVLSQPWTWQKWFFSRTANPKAVMENWTGARNLSSTPSGNDYIFRSLEPKRVVEVRTAARRTLVTVASGTALAFGLMLIYLSELRQPIVLLVAAVTLATLGLLFPGPAVLMAQASIIGVLLALIGQWTALLIHRLSIGRQMLQVPAQRPRDSSSNFQQSWLDANSQAVTAAISPPKEEAVAADSNA